MKLIFIQFGYGKAFACNGRVMACKKFASCDSVRCFTTRYKLSSRVMACNKSYSISVLGLAGCFLAGERVAGWLAGFWLAGTLNPKQSVKDVDGTNCIVNVLMTFVFCSFTSSS